MNDSNKLLAWVLLLTTVPSVNVLNADDSLPLERLSLTADDISGATGLSIYKFRVAMKPGTTFDVAISVQDAPDANPRFLHRYSFTSRGDGEAVDLLLSFLPRDRTLRGVLLSQDEEVEYRVACPNCSPSGIATIVALPLSDIPGTRKMLYPMTAELSATLSHENEICLIAIVASEEGKRVSMEKGFPRATISVRITD